ncbi:MAG: PadR family transcriptional regulator, partial [Rhodocyclales bacterium]|nr:PadR family transcriptional regulator [Rhodocyclales bacterium]
MFHFLRHHHCYQAPMHEHHRHGYGPRGPKTFDAGSLRYVVLQLIAEQARHGYEIIKAIETQVGGGYSPSPGVIYPLLSLLEDQGYVAVTPEGNKKLHAITAEGQKHLDENRTLVEAIQARLGTQDHTHGGRGALRQYMHALKAVVIDRAHDDSASPGRLQQ